MRARRFLRCLICLAAVTAAPRTSVVAGEPFSLALTAGAGLLGAAIAGYYELHCRVMECCQPPWIKESAEGLQKKLDERLFGQHIVKRLLVNAIGQHLTKSNPQKALVLSFHGCQGVGKSFVSRLITSSLFEKGENSSYIHNFVGFRHFYWVSDDDKPRMKKTLQNWIMGNVTACPRSIFVFDEMEVISEGFMDVLTPFLDYHAKIDGTDFRKSIFIFVTNAGANEIRDLTVEYFTSGRPREELDMADFRKLLETAAYNEGGGLKMSAVIEKRLVDYHFPFLPLEKQHVRKCIEYEFKSNGARFSKEDVEDVLGQLDFFPDGLEAFSIDGCRSVYRLVSDLLAHRHTR